MSATVMAALKAVKAQNFVVLTGFALFGTTTIGCTKGGTTAERTATWGSGPEEGSAANPARDVNINKITIEMAGFMESKSRFSKAGRFAKLGRDPGENRKARVAL